LGLKEEVTGSYRKLQNEELHSLYSVANIIRKIESRRVRWVGHVACTRVEKFTQELVRRNVKGRDHFGRYRHKWEDSIKMDLYEMCCEGIDWIHMVQARGQS
jgi:hypothetical protein